MFDVLTAMMSGWMTSQDRHETRAPAAPADERKARFPVSPFQIVTIANLSAQR